MRTLRAPRRVATAVGGLLLALAGVAGVSAALTDTFSVATPDRIMAMGDSITRGGGSGWGEGFRLPLVQRMLNGGYTSDMVGSQNSGPPWLYDRTHEGYGGYRIDDIKGLAAAELTAYRPNYVLLMVGSNDIQANDRTATAPDRLSALIDLITTTVPAAQVIVASITPLADPPSDGRAQTYNAAIPGIVAAKASAGKHVSFVDMYPLLTLADIPDGVHPNDAGYAKLAAAWAAALAGLRATPPPVSTRSCPCTIWGTADGPVTPQVASTTAAEVGVKFRTEKAGYITGVRFYKGPDNAGPHEGKLWKAISNSSTWTVDSTTMTGELLATGTVTSEVTSGWQEITFPSPVPVQANALYFASYYAPFGRYAADAGYFRDREIVHSPVRLPSQGSVDGNGFINLGGPGLPSPDSELDANYWVDVVFLPGVPAAPAAVTATATSSTQINVGWSSAADATGYSVERSTDGNTWTVVSSTTGNVLTYGDSGLTGSTAYSYRVVATNAVGSSPASTPATATTNSAAPLAPATFTATTVSSSQIDLTWSSAATATGYRVERAIAPTGPWSPVATVPVTAYSDKGLPAGTTYSYRIVSLNGAAESAPSVVRTATTQPAPDVIAPTAPAGLTAPTAKGKVNLSWTGSTDSGGSGLAGYRVSRSDSGVSGQFVLVATVSGTSYTDSPPKNKPTYWYRVTAYDNAGNQSSASNTVSAQPK